MSKLHTPVATYRMSVATRYWHSARIIVAQQNRPAEFMEPVGHLLSMAAELALKAFLSEVGMASKELGHRKVGHDLGALLRLCIERGLEISEDDSSGLLDMRTAHLEHFHRYGPSDPLAGAFAIVLTDERKTLSLVARLIDLISKDPRILRRLYQHPADLDWPLALPPLQPVPLGRLAEIAKSSEDRACKVAAIGVPHR